MIHARRSNTAAGGAARGSRAAPGPSRERTASRPGTPCASCHAAPAGSQPQSVTTGERTVLACRIRRRSLNSSRRRSPGPAATRDLARLAGSPRRPRPGWVLPERCCCTVAPTIVATHRRAASQDACPPPLPTCAPARRPGTASGAAPPAGYTGPPASSAASRRSRDHHRPQRPQHPGTAWHLSALLNALSACQQQGRPT